MQIEIQAAMEKNERIAPVVPAVNQGGQTFELPELITDFCNWYRGCLADQNRQLNTTISADIPRYIQGNRLFMKHLFFEVGKCSLLCGGSGEVSVKIDTLQHTSRRHRLTYALTLTGATIPFARQKEFFQALPHQEPGHSCHFRSANLYYAQMIARSCGGDIQIDNSAEPGVRYLVEINIFTSPC